MISFSLTALDYLRFWIQNDRKIALRILRIIEEIKKDPFVGIGKPEQLKGDFKGFWSRRITDEQRIIYKYTELQLIIHSCRFHYN